MPPGPDAPRSGDALDRASLKAAALLMLGCLVLSLAFAGSYVGALHDPQPHGLPVAVAGPPPVADRAAAALRQAAGERFAVRTVPDRQAGVDALLEREVYGVLVPGQGASELLVASAAGAAADEAVETFGRRAAQAQGQRLSVQDVRPLPQDDARGISPFYLAVGWVVGGYLGATAIGLTRGMAARGRRLALIRLGALALYALALGIASTALVDGVIGTLGGAPVGLALLGALTVFATATVTGALQSLLGIAGTGVMLLLFVVLGNPGSGGPYAPELLPGLWRETGAYLAPGAGTEAVRDLVYFDGNGMGTPLLVLAVYAVVGAAVMVALGARRRTSDRDLAGASALAA